MGVRYNLIGFVSGNLTVLEQHANRDSQGSYQWICKCLCGDIKVTSTNKLVGTGAIKSCGCCQWHIKHKDAYISWQGMKRRCEDDTEPNFKYYKGKGITVCDSWKVFENFFKDMGDPPVPFSTECRYTLDRLDNSLGYFKDNCRWASKTDQIDNRGCSKV